MNELNTFSNFSELKPNKTKDKMLNCGYWCSEWGSSSITGNILKYIA